MPCLDVRSSACACRCEAAYVARLRCIPTFPIHHGPPPSALFPPGLLDPQVLNHFKGSGALVTLAGSHAALHC